MITKYCRAERRGRSCTDRAYFGPAYPVAVDRFVHPDLTDLTPEVSSSARALSDCGELKSLNAKLVVETTAAGEVLRIDGKPARFEPFLQKRCATPDSSPSTSTYPQYASTAAAAIG